MKFKINPLDIDWYSVPLIHLVFIYWLLEQEIDLEEDFNNVQ